MFNRKPRLVKRKGRWRCYEPLGIHTEGDSPEDAYNEWHKVRWLQFMRSFISGGING